MAENLSDLQRKAKAYEDRNSDGLNTWEGERSQSPPDWEYADVPMPPGLRAADNPEPEDSSGYKRRAIFHKHVYEPSLQPPKPPFDLMSLNPIAWYDPNAQPGIPMNTDVDVLYDRTGHNHHATWTGPGTSSNGKQLGKATLMSFVLNGNAGWHLEEAIEDVEEDLTPHRPYQTNIPSLPCGRVYFAVVQKVQTGEGDSCLFGPGSDETDRRGGTEIVLARRNDVQPGVHPFWAFYFAEDVDPPGPQKYHWSDVSIERSGDWTGIFSVIVQHPDPVHHGFGAWGWNGVEFAFGPPVYAQTCTVPGCDADTGKNMMLFSSRQDDYPFVGSVGDIIVFPELSEPNREKVEGYLAWKYGMQEMLTTNQQFAGNANANHPYRFAPP